MSGKISRAVEYSYNQDIVCARLENDPVAAMRAGAKVFAKLRMRGIAGWGSGNPLAVLTDCLHERQRTGRIVGGDVIADFFQIESAWAVKRTCFTSAPPTPRTCVRAAPEPRRRICRHRWQGPS